MSEQNKPVMTAQEVMDVIPNRYPMFFVDRVEELDLEKGLLQQRMLQQMSLISKDTFLETQSCQGFYKLKQWHKLVQFLY